MIPSSEPSREDAVRAVRHPTADPHQFLIPADQLPPGFAARVDDPAYVPAAPRPAATVVLVREGARGSEALLLRRPQRSRFAAGAWVFPGGAVDPEDADPELAAHASGPSPADWAARLGLDDPAEAWGFVVAALREAWEETGILLAAGGSGERGDRLDAAREELLTGARTLRALLMEERITLATADLLYVAHWITPEPEPRRYDTRFFVARVPEGATCMLHGDELAEARWVRPEDAVRGFAEGELTLLPPTLHTLQRLAGYPSLSAIWTALRDAPVPVYLPRMRRAPDGVLLEIPQDGGR